MKSKCFHFLYQLYVLCSVTSDFPDGAHMAASHLISGDVFLTPLNSPVEFLEGNNKKIGSTFND